MTKTIQPEGNFYDKYNSGNPMVKRIMAGFFASMDSLLEGLDFSNVYEAGCGEGTVSEHIYKLKNGRVECSASDISHRLVGEASQKFPHIRFSQGSIYDIECEDEAYDLVVASEVLEHLEDPERAIRELFRVSKKYVFISVPNEPIWRIANLLRGKYIRKLGNTPGHIQHWNKRSILKLVDTSRGGGGGATPLIFSPFPWIMVLYQN